MTKSSFLHTYRRHAKTLFPLLLFVLSLLITVRTTYYATSLFLDGDASSELLLAEHLSKTGQILSRDWYYSTELRVLHTQLVFAPLFRLFSDWQTVRFLGTLILQAILILSFLFLNRSLHLSTGAFFLGASLLILPSSVSYGRIVLYHCYYLPHIAVSFFLIGLYLRILESAHAPFRLALLLIFSALSFAGSLGGVRYLLIVYIPLALTLLPRFLFARDEQSLSALLRENPSRIAVLLVGVVSCLLGIAVNKFLLADLYFFDDYTALELMMMEADHFREVVYGLLHLFGYRISVSALSPIGIASLGCFYVLGYFILQSISIARNQETSSAHDDILQRFPITALLFSVGVLFLLFSSANTYSRYILPGAVWFVVFLCGEYDRLPDFRLHMRELRFFLCLLILLVNAGFNTLYFNTHWTYAAQPYTGLSNVDPQMVEHLEKPIAFLKENGYTYGYSTDFWSCNTITELTDGEYRVTMLTAENKDAPFSIRKWLTLREYEDIQPDKTYLMMTTKQRATYKNHPLIQSGRLIYPSDGYFVIYGYDDPSVFTDMLQETEYTGMLE